MPLIVLYMEILIYCNNKMLHFNNTNEKYKGKDKD